MNQALLVEIFQNDIIAPYNYTNGDNIKFRINTPVGQGFGDTNKFCNNETCWIPCVFKGYQIVNFLDKRDRTLYTHKAFCDRGSVDCTIDFDYPFCRFEELHLKSGYEGIIYTPYKVQLNKTIALNCRSQYRPYLKITSVQTERPKNLTYRYGIYQYMAPTCMLQMFWHYLLEQFIPQYYGWVYHYGQNKLTHFLTPDKLHYINDAHSNTHKIWALVTNLPLETAQINAVYQVFNAGTIIAQRVIKVNGKCWDPRYNFTGFKLDELVYKIYDHYKATATENKKPVIWLNQRKTKFRKILNFDMMHENVKKYFPDAEIYVTDFPKLPYEKLIPMIARVDLLVSVHGSDLTNMVFMKKHSATLELHVYKFHPRIVYTELAQARNTPHYVWYPKRNPFNVTLKWPAECLSGPCVGYNYCYRYAAYQDTLVDVGAVVQYVAKALINLGFNYNISQFPGPGDIKGPGENLSIEL